MDLITDDENILVPSSDHVTKDEILELLNKFVYNFVANIEQNFIFYYKVLEDNPGEKKGSLPGTILSSLASAIPTIGKGIGAAITNGEIYYLKKLDKNRATKLAELIYFYGDNKTKVRNILVKAAIEVFVCFEDQFSKVNCNGGRKRAMYKLAKDAAYRVFQYLVEIDDGNDEFSEQKVTKGIIFGKSLTNNVGQNKGRTVSAEESWTSRKIFEKVGIVIFPECRYFAKAKCNTKKYGYRRHFAWEDDEYLGNNWQLHDVHDNEEEQYILQVNDVLDPDVKKYISSKDAFEEAKQERESYHNSLLKDNEQKQEEIIQNIGEFFGQLIENYTELTIDNKKQTQLIEGVKDNQDNLNQGNNEIKLKLDEIHKDIRETKETQIVLMDSTQNLQEDIIVIKESHGEVDVNKVAEATTSLLIEKGKEALSRVNKDIKNGVQKVEEEGKRVEKQLKKIRIKW